jgi:acylpyruvate hydrolase
VILVISLTIFFDVALSIDVTGRNWQEELKKKGLPWAPAKGFDTWAAVG